MSTISYVYFEQRNALCGALKLDGVMVLMKWKIELVKSCYKEANCVTLSDFDEQDERLKTVRIGRMPESKKVT